MVGHLMDDGGRRAREDALEQRLTVAIEATRLRCRFGYPTAVVAHPIRRRARHDGQAAVAPELSRRAKACGRQHDGHEQRGTDRPDARHGWPVDASPGCAWPTWLS